MLINPLTRLLGKTWLNRMAFTSSAKPTKLFQSLMSCPEAALEKYLREMNKLSDDNIKVCIDILIARMQADELKQNLLLNQLYQTYIRRFPLYHFHSQLTMVGIKLAELLRHHQLKEAKEQKLKIVEINSIFASAFEMLRKLKKQQMEREEPYLLRSFALYHSNILAQLVKDQQVETTLKKAVEIMRRLMSKCLDILENKEKEYGNNFQYNPQEIEQLRAFEKLLLNKQTIPSVQRQAIDRHYETLYYVRKTYTGFYADAVTKLVDITNRLTNPKSNARKEPENIKIHPGLFEMTSSLQKAIQLCRRMGDQKGLSPNYFPMRKMTLELIYEQNLLKIHSYQIPQLKNQFYQLLQDLKQQIIITLSTVNYEEQDAAAFLAAYQVLYKVHLMIKVQIAKQNGEFNQQGERQLLQLIFHQVLNTISNNKMKDMVGLALIDLIQDEYGINFIEEFGKKRENRQLPPKRQPLQKASESKYTNRPKERSAGQLTKSRLRGSSSRRSSPKPSDLQ